VPSQASGAERGHVVGSLTLLSPSRIHHAERTITCAFPWSLLNCLTLHDSTLLQGRVGRGSTTCLGFISRSTGLRRQVHCQPGLAEDGHAGGHVGALHVGQGVQLHPGVGAQEDAQEKDLGVCREGLHSR